ncbi:SDR family oxidoreductase [Mucilaginibacter sp. 22184]|uniref:SDR family oxidoreductase n=1 Tax=Mucilaginibacter sp. 22184 TaxID=3453887 RepID=UPI003F84999C
MKIIVTGSLGNISKPLSAQLIAQGHSVAIVTTDPGKKEAIHRLGAIAAVGSVTDEAFLTGVFTGADAVYTIVPPNFAAPAPIAYYEQVGEVMRKLSAPPASNGWYS